MPLITGPKLDEAVKVLRTWYIETRAATIAALEAGGYPYRSVPVTPKQQVERFISMTPEGWQVLMDKLVDRHRGEPNATELAREDLQDYIRKMNRMAFSRRAV